MSVVDGTTATGQNVTVVVDEEIIISLKYDPSAVLFNVISCL